MYLTHFLIVVTPKLLIMSIYSSVLPELFQEFNADQLKSLPTLSAAVVSEEQLSFISETQLLSLARVQKAVPILNTDSSTEENDRLKGSASSKDLNLLVVVALAVISRFSA